ncbi:MAG: sugar phosphate isomerase/epimerase [Kiritimatiellales bacterium]
MDLMEDFIGVSTNTLTGIDIWDAAELTRKYGLTCMEIHLGDFEAAVGNPWMIPHAGVWPRTFSQDDRKRLREKLGHIKNLTIHGTPLDLNIAAVNPGIREESQKQYREALELAYDLGAKWMTYHQGRPALSVVSPRYVEDRNVEFILSILEQAKEWDIKLAYESFNVNLLERIPDAQFGLLLDVGHAVMAANKFAPEGRGDTQTVLNWIDFCGDRLIEMHMHDVINWAENAALGTAHRAFGYGLCLDLEKIAEKLKEKNRLIPLISEIYEPTAEKAVQTTAEMKERILAMMN